MIRISNKGFLFIVLLLLLILISGVLILTNFAEAQTLTKLDDCSDTPSNCIKSTDECKYLYNCYPPAQCVWNEAGTSVVCEEEKQTCSYGDLIVSCPWWKYCECVGTGCECVNYVCNKDTDCKELGPDACCNNGFCGSCPDIGDGEPKAIRR